MKDELRAVGNIGKNILKTITAPFYLPTFIRRNQDNNFGNYGIILGFTEAAGSFFLGFPALLPMMQPGHPNENSGCYPSIYLTCVGTLALSNIISGIYEFFKYEKNKLKNPIITPNSNSGLETKVEKPIEQPKLEQKPIEIFDPWKVKIDELGNIVYGRRER